jgi:hypothetical protein
MYRVILERGYMQLSFLFDTVLDAAAFIGRVLEKVEQEVKVTIELVKEEGEEECSSEN